MDIKKILEVYPNASEKRLNECFVMLEKKYGIDRSTFIKYVNEIVTSVTSPNVSFELYPEAKLPETRPELKGYTKPIDLMYLSKYFEKKYSNLICIPYVIKPTYQYFLNIMWYYEKEILYTYESRIANNVESRMYSMYTQDYRLSNFIKRCNKRFYVIMLTIASNDHVTAHQTILIIDKDKKTFELFDPHGSQRELEFKYDTLEEKLKDMFKGYNLIPVQQLCPLRSFQTIEYFQSSYLRGEENKRLIENIKEFLKLLENKYEKRVGFCVAWSYFYLDLRMKYPDMNQKKLQEKAIEKLFKGDMLRFIVNYIQFIRKEAKYI